MPENGTLTWFQAVWAGFIAIGSALFYRIFQGMDSKVSKSEFKRYIDGQEKLTEAHVKNTDANTRTIEKIFDKLDGKQDKK